jgi:hypothetical protein
MLAGRMMVVPFDSGWYINERLSYLKYYGEVTDAEVQVAYDVMAEMVERGTAPVHILIDASEIESFPTMASEPDAAIEVEHLGWIMLAADGDVTASLSESMAALANNRFQAYEDLDSALRFLMAVDTSLHLERIDEAD